MNKFALRTLTGLAALAAAGIIHAQAPVDAPVNDFPAEERTRLRDRATALKEQAKTKKEEAARVRDAAHTACWQHTLVSSCLEGADDTYRSSMTSARRLELEASDIERDIRHRSAEARRADKQRAADARREKSIDVSAKTREQDALREEAAAARATKDAELAGHAEAQAREQARKDAEQAARRKQEDARAAQRAADQRRKAAAIDERIQKREEERARREAEAAAKAAAQGAAGKAP